MSAARIRPRFETDVACPPAEALRRISRSLEEPGSPCRGTILGRHVVLSVPEENRRIWSPQLSVDVEGHAAGTRLRGLYGPHPDLWTLFVALYAVSVFGAVTATLFGFAQWSLGHTPSALWLVPASIGLGLMVHAAALIGQHLGTTQMLLLRSFVEAAVIDGRRTETQVEHA